MRTASLATSATIAARTALAVLLVLAAGAVPALAKEGMLARLDAPIALGTPPGAELLVGVTVTISDAGIDRPVEGSPIQLVLTGREGSSMRAAGAPEGKPGHYVMRITVPAGGARRAEVVMHGTSDLPIALTDDPFAFGSVTAGTAQVAPPLKAAMTPFPRASAAAAAPVAIAPAAPVPVGPATEPAAPAGPASPSQFLVAGPVAFVAALGLSVLIAVARRSRRVARPTAPDGASGV